MDGGLKRLSPNEEVTLRRVAQGANTEDLRKLDIARLVQLALVVWQGERLVITPPGRERVGPLPAQPEKPLFMTDSELPPARAAALARREEDLRKMLFGCMHDQGKSLL